MRSTKGELTDDWTVSPSVPDNELRMLVVVAAALSYNRPLGSAALARAGVAATGQAAAAVPLIAPAAAQICLADDDDAAPSDEHRHCNAMAHRAGTPIMAAGALKQIFPTNSGPSRGDGAGRSGTPQMNAGLEAEKKSLEDILEEGYNAGAYQRLQEIENILKNGGGGAPSGLTPTPCGSYPLPCRLWWAPARDRAKRADREAAERRPSNGVSAWAVAWAAA